MGECTVRGPVALAGFPLAAFGRGRVTRGRRGATNGATERRSSAEGPGLRLQNAVTSPGGHQKSEHCQFLNGGFMEAGRARRLGFGDELLPNLLEARFEIQCGRDFPLVFWGILREKRGRRVRSGIANEGVFRCAGVHSFSVGFGPQIRLRRGSLYNPKPQSQEFSRNVFVDGTLGIFLLEMGCFPFVRRSDGPLAMDSAGERPN